MQKSKLEESLLQASSWPGSPVRRAGIRLMSLPEQTPPGRQRKTCLSQVGRELRQELYVKLGDFTSAEGLRPSLSMLFLTAAVRCPLLVA